MTMKPISTCLHSTTSYPEASSAGHSLDASHSKKGNCEANLKNQPRMHG